LSLLKKKISDNALQKIQNLLNIKGNPWLQAAFYIYNKF